MSGDLRIRFTVTRSGLRRGLTLGLLFLLPMRLLSQADPSRSVVLNSSFPSPVGSFSELIVYGANNILLARDGGGVGVGNLGAGAGSNIPQAGLVVIGSANLGSNAAPAATNEALTLQQNGVVGAGSVNSGFYVQNRSGAAPWTVYATVTPIPGAYGGGAAEMLWFSNPAKLHTFGFDGNHGGAARACIWNWAGCALPRVSMFHGGFPGSSPGNVVYWPAQTTPGCSAAQDVNGWCLPDNAATSWHLCCSLR